ncbi:MAG: hypothetical protein KBT02_08000 [Treponema sp.]|nr:hypothetical protein [Candidatus Treponema caballi]
MKRQLICLLLCMEAALCFARGKQEVIVSENYSSEIKNVVVTIVNKTEADFQTLSLTRKEILSDKWELADRRTFILRSGESKSVVLDNQGLYKLELYDSRGHKFSKKNTYSQIITDDFGNVLAEGEFQQFTQSWQKLVFTEEDFEPQSSIDIVEVFFGMYGNEKHDEPPAKSCSAIIVNNTGEQIDYISVVQDGVTRSSDLAIGKGQYGVLDIKQSESADISLISHGQRVFTKQNLVFDAENLMLIFTASDREVDVTKAAQFVSSALGSISTALSATTQVFASAFEKARNEEEFEAVTQNAAEPATATPSSDGEVEQPDAGNETVETGRKTEKSFWSRYFSWLPWVD